MINIKLTSKQNKDSCSLKLGKNIIIALAYPDTYNVDRIQLFNGVNAPLPPKTQNYFKGKDFGGLMVRFSIAFNRIITKKMPVTGLSNGHAWFGVFMVLYGHIYIKNNGTQEHNGKGRNY